MGKVVKKVGKAIGSVFKAVTGFVGMLFTGPKVPKASANTSTETRLQASLVPEETFKVIFGETAAGTDIRFWETFGSGNNGHVQVIAAACHEITAFGNLYLDEKPVSFSGNNATGVYAGLLSRRQVLKGISGAGIALGSGTRWTASSSMTGCAWFALIWTYNQEKMPQGIPSRVTQVVKGAKVYDPRRDSTRGGSGAHRADNPATWEYLPTDSNGQPIGRNNALQMLAYTLGIRALSPVTGQWELRAGRGADPADVDFDTFIAAANACEVEGWYSDCILSTGDSHGTNEGILEAASGGRLSDTGGRFSYYVSTDDTANVAAFFNESDIIGETDWEPAKPMSEQYNQLPGTFTDPAALFQTRPLPLCFSQEYYDQDGYKKRAEPEKLSSVQDPVQGQKLLRRKLNRSRLQGTFTATFNLRGLKVRDHSIVRLTFAQLGFVNKLFRVVQQGISKGGGIQLVLEEESPAIYLPGPIVAVPPPSVGEGGDPSLAVSVSDLAANPSGVTSGASARDAIRVSFSAPGQNVGKTEGRFKKTGDVDWSPLPPLTRDQTGWFVHPLLPATNYTFEARHVTLFEVPGPWATVSQTTNSVTLDPAGRLIYSNGATVDSLRPGEAGANVTESRTSAFVNGQGALATQNTVTAAQVPRFNVSNDFIDEDFGSTLIVLVSPTSFDVSSETTGAMGIIKSIKTPAGNGTLVPSQAQLSTVSSTALVPVDGSGGKFIRFNYRTLIKAGFTGLLRSFLYFVGPTGATIGSAVITTAVDRRASAQPSTAVIDVEQSPIAVPAGAAHCYFIFFIDWSSSQPNAGYALIGKPGVRRIADFGSLTPDAVRFGANGNVRRADGVTQVTDATVVTAIGTAMFLNNQGMLATYNVPAYASNAAAISAGLSNGLAFFNTTTLKLETVIRTPGDNVGTIFATVGHSGSVSNALATAYGTVYDSKDKAGVPVGATIDPIVELGNLGNTSTASASASFLFKVTEQLVSGGTENLLYEGEISLVSSDLDLGGGNFQVSGSAYSYLRYVPATLSGNVKYRLYLKKLIGNSPALGANFTIQNRIFNP